MVSIPVRVDGISEFTYRLCILAQIFLSTSMALAQQQSKPTPSVSLAPERPQQVVPPLSPEAQDPLLLRAHQAAEEGSFAKADATVREFLRQHPSSADAHDLLGYILYRQLRAKESLSEYTLAAKTESPPRWSSRSSPWTMCC